MSYAIGNIIWGFPIEDVLYNRIAKKLGEDWEEEFDKKDGILSWYGGDEKCLAFGIQLYAIDEFSNINLSQLSHSLATFNPVLPPVPEKLKEFFLADYPKYWIVWSLS